MGKRTDINHILVIGSGPIIIGQACEFDYSGCQAVKALKEEGYEISVLNPNPATVMTTPDMADHIFMEPLKKEYVEKIFQEYKIDAILSTMGGQTALNLSIELEESGLLEKYGVEVIGASIDSIKKAEDRGIFKDIITDLGLESAQSAVVKNKEEALKFKEKIGLPIIIRPSFTLGGMGGSIAETEEEFLPLVEKALEISPVHETLLEESLIGWQEFEMEVMRDNKDNAIIVCSIENIDPMGVHTGDSITIAPALTLSDDEFQKMRNASIEILRAVGVECGGSNVQFALHPVTKRMIIIEMNPRVSRSSALASKATGFPIARCSAKLAIGYTLDEVINEITGQSVSCFEPSLDYTAVKVPRFELEKFPLKASGLGTQMRSVGEALSLGRTILEALNKAIRASERKFNGIEELDPAKHDIDLLLHSAHPLRFLAAYSVIKAKKYTAKEVSSITGFNRFFVHQLTLQAALDEKIETNFNVDILREAKVAGMSDIRIAKLSNKTVKEIKQLRKDNKIQRVYHFVDTCAGETKALTPYCYSTFSETDEGEPLKDKGVIIIASGPNRIGQGLEFDTCCTLSSLSYRKRGRKSIMVNSNPETVSTDYNISDRLYIEPLTSEEILSIVDKEQTKDVVVQLGGQTPLNMARDLEEAGCRIIGTSLAAIEETEDRELFSSLIKRLNLRQPENRSAFSRDEVIPLATQIGFPVLLRPSFVLGGRSMTICYGSDDLQAFLEREDITISKDAPLLVDQFLEDAFEYDVDCVSDSKSLYVGGILQHIEAAGIHSGDSAAVFPPYKSKPEILNEMKEWALKIAREIKVIGLMNIQFAEKDGKLYIIEVNPRASRTVPFISKTSGVDLIDTAVRIWEGEDLVKQGLVKEEGSIAEGKCQTGWAVKEAVFSFDRFSDIDPALGPEMRSTGEVIGCGETFGEAFAKSQTSSGNRLPNKGRVIISVNKKDRLTILPLAQKLQEIGFEILCTRGTARDLFSYGLLTDVVLKVHEGHPNVVDLIRAKKADLIINTPMGYFARSSEDDIRSEAMRAKIPYTTTTSAAKAAVEAIIFNQENSFSVKELSQN